MSETFNVLMVGVGGQGIVLASDIMAEAAAAAGLDVKKSEIHGMSRRGGPVFAHVRFGQRVHSPVISQGEADVILAMEPMELLRWTPWAAPDAAAVYLNAPMLPIGVTEYPGDLAEELRRLYPRLVQINARQLRAAKVAPKVRNTALLGAASVFTDIDLDSWTAALTASSPRGTYETNQAAFDTGRQLAVSTLEASDVE